MEEDRALTKVKIDEKIIKQINTDAPVGRQINTDLLHADLTFNIRGAIFEVANKYGKGFKEIIYQAALVEEFTKRNIPFEEQKRITVYSIDTGKPLGYYT